VYVAEGSHASYFSSGYHFNGGAEDTSNGDGEVVAPTLIDVSSAPAWIGWPGRWGGSDSSPRSPAQQDARWDDPVAWANSVDPCTEEQTRPFNRDAASPREEAPSRPALPHLSVRLVGNRVVIIYRFLSFPTDQGRRPWMMLTSVDSHGEAIPPLTVRSLVRGPTGRIVQPLGRGRAPFRVLVSVKAANGARSRTITVPLR
jgi:hypothetical protein